MYKFILLLVFATYFFLSCSSSEDDNDIGPSGRSILSEFLEGLFATGNSQSCCAQTHHF